MPTPSVALPVLFFFCVSLFSSTQSVSDDGQSLLAFKKLITADPSNSMADWSPAVPFCNWTAITCSRRHTNRVVSLDLHEMDLRGTISSSLGNLSFLRALYLSGNALHGHIPPQLGRLSRLRELALHSNQLEGNIPSQLSSCTNLVQLGLSYNSLSGNIPGKLGFLKHLQELYLGTNNLTEYGLGQEVSTKGDVYSYGILLLEMLTRKKSTDDMFVGDLNLHKWVNMAFPNKVNEVIDNNLLSQLVRDEFDENNVHKCLLSLLRVGLLCSKDSPTERPTMRDVVILLETLKENLVENILGSRRLRKSISNLLDETNGSKNDAPASNDQSSSTF